MSRAREVWYTDSIDLEEMAVLRVSLYIMSAKHTESSKELCSGICDMLGESHRCLFLLNDMARCCD